MFTSAGRALRLFLKLLYSPLPLRLSYLAHELECSKQTIIRLIEEIRGCGYELKEFDLEDRQRAYQMVKPDPCPPVEFSDKELDILWMCQAFAQRLMGVDLSDEARQTIGKMHHLSQKEMESQKQTKSWMHFSSFGPGTIDYTPFQENLRTLIEAMNEQKVCRVTYNSPQHDEPKTFHVQPLKIFCHENALYLHAQKSKEPGKKFVRTYDPLLAIHRIKEIVKTDRQGTANPVKDFDFNDAYNREFGVIKEGKTVTKRQNKFQVVAELTDWAAVYVEERYWGPDAESYRQGDNLIIEFSASSEPEIIRWILQFGEHGRLLEPDKLVKELSRITTEMKAKY
jgi:predicted DNA-binding transcriptional regulator YafY